MADALSGPAGTSLLVDAAHWVQGTLLGTLATTLAVIAVAWIGFGMLNGRINLQRGAIVILGCFIVFGAPVIAAGLMRAGEAGSGGGVAVAPPPAPPPPSAPAPKPSPAYDPYAGASVPVR
ncbi:TrbC/VirB2 family protein [Sphingomonas sp.]|uniref:TrbC/VirB2 family protein n=1 Tax=Sphingomonas sp. TaxID=28214 RepID=UPI0031D6F584